MNEGTPTVEVSKTRRQIIERPRLTRLLDASTARIITLVAPAGYGKTTLARQWVAEHPGATAWFTNKNTSIDAAAYSLALGRVIGMTANVVDGAVDQRAHSRNPRKSIDELLEALLHAIEKVDAGLLLVLDDYHAIADIEPLAHLTERIIVDAPCRTMVLSRERPRWATPRRLFYGEVFEVGRSVLALDADEVTRLMPEAPTAVAQGLASLSEGWPAVIALAARLPVLTAPDAALPGDLHEFFAEELFNTLDRGTQADLELLALTGPLARTSLGLLLPHARVDGFLVRAEQTGFITSATSPDIEMHPLLKSFLLAKIEMSETRLALVERALAFLTEQQRWDEAFEIADQFDQPATLVDIVTAATPPMLSAGRVETLSDWIQRIRATGVEAPELDVAGAECAFRTGQHYEALGLALTAAEKFGSTRADAAAHALTIAGRSAHTLSDEESAYAHYRAARSIAISHDTKRLAGWGLLSCALDLETDEARVLLDELAAESDGSPHDVVAHAVRRLNLEARFGKIENLPAGRAANALLSRVHDPVLRASFRNVFGYVLVLSGFYAEASAVMDQQFDDCDRSRLSFALPYAHATASMVASAHGAFDTADTHLDAALEAALATDDRFAAVNTHAARSRLECSRGNFDRAVAVASIDDAYVIRSMKAELAAWRGLALACRGDYADGSQVAEFAVSLSRSIEPRVIAACTAGIVAIRVRNPATDDVLRSVVQTTADAGNVDSLACSYRAAPELFRALAAIPDIRESFRSLVTRAGDERLLNLWAGSEQDRLTPREKEVLRCISQGLSNQRIADELVISLSTAKVHVHRVLEKLGVPTRSAAAARAAIDPSLYAAPETRLPVSDSDASA